MAKFANKPLTQARKPRARNTHARQRQRLIDACISALHLYGPSQTTVEKVVAIAKMSPGIVRFYFASKAAMLVASLQFLSAEFEEQLLVPVARLKSRPVAALELMVDLYLDPDIASPRKVSVWYAFWGEASSRQEYYDICGQKDESFAVLVRELIERLIEQSGRTQLDADAVALGLIGVLEILWQDFAFRREADIDRGAAKRRAMAYLRSVFPGEFAVRGSTPGSVRPPAGWAYADRGVFAAERQALFASAWQLVGHASQLQRAGDFLTADLKFERALVVRDESGALRAFRNSCSAAPHILVSAACGHADTLACAPHGLNLTFEGMADDGSRLETLEVCDAAGLVWVRKHAAGEAAAPPAAPFEGLALPPRARPLGAPRERQVAADWKILAEQWCVEEVRLPALAAGWSARAYRCLVGEDAGGELARRFAAPNHLIETRRDGVSILQVLPVAPGRSLLREHRFSACQQEPLAGAASFLASRLSALSRTSSVALAESMQEGMLLLDAAAGARRADASLVKFWAFLDAHVAALRLPRPAKEA